MDVDRYVNLKGFSWSKWHLIIKKTRWRNQMSISRMNLTWIPVITSKNVISKISAQFRDSAP